MSRTHYPSASPDGSPFPGLWARVRAAVAEFAAEVREPVSLMGRVIYALILRQATTLYGQRSAGYVWGLLMPTLQLAVMAALFALAGRESPAGDYMLVFLLTGILPLILWRNTMTRNASAIAQSRGLMNYPAVKPFEIVTARAILEVATMLMVALIFVVVLWTFYGIPVSEWIDDPLSLLGALGTLAFFSYGTGMFSAQLGRIFEPWRDFSSFVGRAAFFTSGIFFTLNSIPPALRKYVQLNPLAHCIEWIRAAGIPGYSSDLFDPVYPLTCGLILLVLGMTLDWLIRISGYSDQ